MKKIVTLASLPEGSKFSTVNDAGQVSEYVYVKRHFSLQWCKCLCEDASDPVYCALFSPSRLVVEIGEEVK